MAQEVALKKENVPAYLKPKSHSVGNVDATDRLIPRIKLLHGISPEVEAFESAKAGTFWHTIAEQSIGKDLRIVVIKIRKTYELWAPRGDKRGRLARSVDCVNWDVKQTFTVKPKNAPEQQWSTEDGTVKASGLAEWGSSIDGESNSQPAAALTYGMLLFLPDYPELSPVMAICTRSACRPTQSLIAKMDMRPTDHFYQQYKMGVVKDTNDNNEDYFNYTFTADGYVSEEQSKITEALFDRFKDEELEATNEVDDGPEANEQRPSSKPSGKVGGGKGKF